MDAMHAQGKSDARLLEANRKFYDLLWRDARLIRPDRFNTWPLVSDLVAKSTSRLEVAPGLRPRLPIAGTHFVDISGPALSTLKESGGRVVYGSVSALPYPDASFDLVAAMDIVEHVDEDDRAMSELSRVSAPGATFLMATPLFQSRWTGFDEFVGHRRRYEPDQLLGILHRHGLEVQSSAVYGMQPKSSRWTDLGVYYLTHHRERAMWWYNRVMMPLALKFEKKLSLVPGMLETSGVDEVLLVCRRAHGPVTPA
jgi:SAM-dependent methyltransferase